jgi:hypothetical protein
MQAVYSHSIGGVFVSETAPAILLPGLDPLGLDEALRILAAGRVWMRAAIWTIARSIPPAPLDSALDAAAGVQRYPRALLDVIDDSQYARLWQFERVRGGYAAAAALLASAIVSCAPLPDAWARFDGICRAYLDTSERATGLDDELRRVLAAGGLLTLRNAMVEYLEHELHRHSEGCHLEAELKSFERQVGMGLGHYLVRFADSLAFTSCFPVGNGSMILPAASITTQDTDSLTTHVTVSALVAGNTFAALRSAMDPQSWGAVSGSLWTTGYVQGPFDLVPPDPYPERGDPGPAPKMLEETVVILWDREQREVSSAHNVIRLDRLDFDASTATIDVEYELCRSIDTRLMWDVRSGGMLLDDGFSVARPVGPVPAPGQAGVWRVTSTKSELFSDRAPYTSGAGHVFGEALNLLAPAVVGWWLEMELLSYTVPAAPGRPTGDR